jgi:hypothetical protein
MNAFCIPAIKSIAGMCFNKFLFLVGLYGLSTDPSLAETVLHAYIDSNTVVTIVDPLLHLLHFS